MHIICIVSLVALHFIQDNVLVVFLEISYCIPSMAFKDSEQYECEHLSIIVVYEFKHITKIGGMCVIKVYVSQPGWFHELMV